MESPLDLGQSGKGGQGAPGHAWRKPSLLHQPDDVGMGANNDVVGDVNDGQGGGDTRPQNRLGIETPARKGQPFQESQNLIEIGSGIEKTAESHIPGDAGEAVKPGDRRGRPDPDVCFHLGRRALESGAGSAHGRIRATAQAAPKPLSMPTTVRPAAQEACMARRAVTPSRAAP